MGRSVVLVMLLVSSACAAPGVVRGATTTPSLSRVTTAIVLEPLARAPEATTERRARRPDEAERLAYASTALQSLYANAALSDTTLTDGHAPFRVAYELVSWVAHDHGNEPRWWVGQILGDLTLGIACLLMIDSHADTTHELLFTMRVFDERDASDAIPVFEHTYEAQMHTWIAAGTDGPSGADRDQFLRAQGLELARTVFDLSAADVEAAIRALARDEELAQGLASPVR